MLADGPGLKALCGLLSIVGHLDQLAPMYCNASSWQSTSMFAEDISFARGLVSSFYQSFRRDSKFLSACWEQDLCFNYVLQLDRTADTGTCSDLKQCRLAAAAAASTTVVKPVYRNETEEMLMLALAVLSENSSQKKTYLDRLSDQLKPKAQSLFDRIGANCGSM